LANDDSVRLDAALAHLKSADSIGIFRKSLSLARADRPRIIERGDVVVAMRSGPTALCDDEMAADDPHEQAPIWLHELETRPPLPPLRERGVFWPRAVWFLIACGIAAPLSYYFAMVTSLPRQQPIEVAAAPPPAALVASGQPVQSPPKMRDRLLASVAGARSAPAQQGALAHEPAFEQPEPPRSPATTTGVAGGSARSSPPPASVSATKAANLQDLKVMMDRGKQFFESGDLITARILFLRAANAGDAAAAVAMGSTYDPIVLADRGVLGVVADLAKARSWYERAKEMGSPEGPRRLQMLANR